MLDITVWIGPAGPDFGKWKVFLKMLQSVQDGIVNLEDMARESGKARAVNKKALSYKINRLSVSVTMKTKILEGRLVVITQLLAAICLVVGLILSGIIVTVLCQPEILKKKEEEWVVAMANTWMYVITRGMFGETLSQKREREEREKREKLKKQEEEMVAELKRKEEEEMRIKDLERQRRMTVFQRFLERNNVGRKW